MVLLQLRLNPFLYQTYCVHCAVEKGLEAINDQSIDDMARAKITTVIKNAKPPEPNVTVREMNALKTICNEIVVLKADKGNTT